MSECITDFPSSGIPAASANQLNGTTPGRLRLLVVEGDAATLANLAAVLAKRGFDVESFDGHSALHDRALALHDALQGEGGALHVGPGLRRPPAPEKIVCGKLLIDPAERRTWWNGVEVILTAGEFRIVMMLAVNAGCCVDYRTVYDHLHYKGFQSGYGEKGFWVNVRGVIRHIRAKFRAADSSFDVLDNIRAFGYRWRKPS